MREILDLVYMRDLVHRGMVKSIREAARLTQEEVARDVGVHPSTVAHWEQGHVPGGEPAVRYASLLRELEEMQDA